MAKYLFLKDTEQNDVYVSILRAILVSLETTSPQRHFLMTWENMSSSPKHSGTQHAMVRDNIMKGMLQRNRQNAN